MSSYFIRYTTNPQADMERGFSFVGYMLFTNKADALENIADLTGAMWEREDFDLEAWMSDNDDLVGQDNVTGKWGQKRSGLCGYGSFDTLEVARAFVAEKCGADVAINCGAIFTGVEKHDSDIDGQDAGITFAPIAIVEAF